MYARLLGIMPTASYPCCATCREIRTQAWRIPKTPKSSRGARRADPCDRRWIANTRPSGCRARPATIAAAARCRSAAARRGWRRRARRRAKLRSPSSNPFLSSAESAKHRFPRRLGTMCEPAMSISNGCTRRCSRQRMPVMGRAGLSQSRARHRVRNIRRRVGPPGTRKGSRRGPPQTWGQEHADYGGNIVQRLAQRMVDCDPTRRSHHEFRRFFPKLIPHNWQVGAAH
jgi:hypothetical protein